ncbi:uncharacterized protein LOC123314781 [Coccinella septempunctata]|uniref:uncharacterized protein LOC123314781 n=1 Tax=Coccinella septempunctata TaxID=41139 RepID=UPI001D08DFD9|nr:uncharacterized protein LOC123314781 [Coccinella septempunctata]
MPDGFSYDQLAPSSSSSDEGIREENTKDSNVNEVSSSTLNDKGMSLHSFPVESEIFVGKSPLSIQTFLNDSHVGPRRKMDSWNFSMQIPPSPKRPKLVVSTFRYKYLPPKPVLSVIPARIVEIPSRKDYMKSKDTNTEDKKPLLTTHNVPAFAISNKANMSISTFREEILPFDKHAESSENLKKLARQMMTLQGVFKRVRVIRDLNPYTVKRPKGSGCVEIKQFLENAETQTATTIAQNTDFSPSKVESLILECEFYRAAANLIRRYPFYYDFLKRCYSGGNFDDRHEKLRHLRPKQKNFKRAVIHAQGCNNGHLEAVNSVLLEVFQDQDCLCLE